MTPTKTTVTAPFHIGDTVRRGRGTTLWRITDITDNFVSLLSEKDGWTHASVPTAKTSTLSHATPADDQGQSVAATPTP